MLLGPFEQLEREFGWEGGPAAVPIRPPSAFCSLADIQEDGEKAADDDDDDVISDECNDVAISESVEDEFSASDLVNGEVGCGGLNDSGVCDLQEVRADHRRDLR
jgi:hypothetical protein